MSRNRRILAFSGAGISKESGIDTFLERPEIRDALYREVANTNPKRYKEAILAIKKQVENAQPNDAHLALAQYQVEVITMNIDGLHEKAGSKVIALHGTLPLDNEMDRCHRLTGKPVLYGDAAPNYSVAIDKVLSLQEGDIFLVIGASLSTAISGQLQALARYQNAEVIQIQSQAATRVRQVLEELGC